MKSAKDTSKSVPRRAARATGGTQLGQDCDRETKRRAAVILEVLAGLRTPTQAAEALAIGLPRYYQLEARALRGLLEACAAQPKGRQASVSRELAALEQDKVRLQRELGRQQSLVRLAQRAIGLTPPPATPPPRTARKGRRRRPTARALVVAQRLQLQAAADASATADNNPPPPS